MAVIELEKIAFAYSGTPVVGPVDLAIDSGQIVSIMGPSGCGKSTLLRLIAGLEKAGGGVCRIDGLPSERPSAALRFSFQDYDAYPWRTVRENLLLGGACEHSSRKGFAVEELLERVGLAGHEGKYPPELSGGMRKRLALGRCLAGRPRLILLDEPFSSLDSDARHEMYDVLQTLWTEWQCLIVIVTHDVHEAILLSHRILVSEPLPFRIKGEVQIRLPRPRKEAMSETAEYLAKAHELRTLLRSA